MSPTPTPSQRPQTQTHHSTPLAQFIQTEPITRHTQPWNPSPIPMNFTAASASTTPTGTNPFQPRAQPTSPCTPTRAQAQAQKPKYEARYANIANPMKNTSALARAKTRKMFLNRVRGEREEGRFEARGEQMMLMEHLADRRRWEEYDADVLDEIIAQEEEAMQRAFMETQNGVHGRVELLRGDGPNVSFSDDEYEDIFMGLSDPQGQQFQSQSQSQDMDMS
ncbi:uncharacterized protein N7515_006524 [Penicillium bovifimosum]|uniref:Uncharacterized protein n=1 Tax=Penicillium bovifimosum TaxID=126998 RepID=A0A9W9GUT8_9EURO|nr:uncharacterized protein N7515_006524 [Penicillium bovifimosum]KAJ5130485.1 hypothetical protein N7515_006524 [Penicillium bovifimosum]